MVNGIFSLPLLDIRERRMKFIIMQLIEISPLNNKLKNSFVGIFHFTFGQLVYCSERAKEPNLKESD